MRRMHTYNEKLRLGGFPFLWIHSTLFNQLHMLTFSCLPVRVSLRSRFSTRRVSCSCIEFIHCIHAVVMCSCVSHLLPVQTRQAHNSTRHHLSLDHMKRHCIFSSYIQVYTHNGIKHVSSLNRHTQRVRYNSSVV